MTKISVTLSRLFGNEEVGGRLENSRCVLLFVLSSLFNDCILLSRHTHAQTHGHMALSCSSLSLSLVISFSLQEYKIHT